MPDNLPEFVIRAGKTFVVLQVQDALGDTQDLKVTIADVIEYYQSQARNISSGIRSLAGLVGDWRLVDELAGWCLEYFKNVNIVELRRAALRKGLTPKF